MSALGIRKLRAQGAVFRKEFSLLGVPMGVGAKIVCSELGEIWAMGDTVVQYAAYLNSSSFGERVTGIIRF